MAYVDNSTMWALFDNVVDAIPFLFADITFFHFDKLQFLANPYVLQNYSSIVSQIREFDVARGLRIEQTWEKARTWCI